MRSRTRCSRWRRPSTRRKRCAAWPRRSRSTFRGDRCCAASSATTARCWRASRRCWRRLARPGYWRRCCRMTTRRRSRRQTRWRPPMAVTALASSKRARRLRSTWRRRTRRGPSACAPAGSARRRCSEPERRRAHARTRSSSRRHSAIRSEPVTYAAAVMDDEQFSMTWSRSSFACSIPHTRAAAEEVDRLLHEDSARSASGRRWGRVSTIPG